MQAGNLIENLGYTEDGNDEKPNLRQRESSGISNHSHFHPGWRQKMRRKYDQALGAWQKVEPTVGLSEGLESQGKCICLLGTLLKLEREEEIYPGFFLPSIISF